MRISTSFPSRWPLRTPLRAACRLLGLVLLATGSLLAQPGLHGSSKSEAGKTEAGAGFELLRAPLYGLGIEHDAKADTYRLVRRGTTLCEGSLRRCEDKMLGLLRERFGTGRPNFKFKTFGGKQVWADEFVFAGWRIQQNVFTDHCRLLDPSDVRYAWGSFDACRVAFEEQRMRRRLALKHDHAVVLLHGMGRSHHSYKKLVQRLRLDGYEIVAINYPSTRRAIVDHAKQVSRVLTRLDGVKKVSFVAHSMGGIVARELLARDAPWKRRMTPMRLVMLGAPNQGSALADRLGKGLPYRLLAGDGGQGLTTAKLKNVPLPTIPFGVIAGGRGDDEGYNPLIPGDDDGIVAVATTKLRGAQGFLLVRSLHTFLMANAQVIAATRRFLRTGKF